MGRRVKVYQYGKTAGLDYFIGDINYIHKGYGPKMIIEFINQVVKPFGFDYVTITPNKENIVSRKCCEKCGLNYFKTVNVPYRTSKKKEAVYIKNLWFWFDKKFNLNLFMEEK